MRGRTLRVAITDVQIYLIAFVTGLLLGVLFFQMKNDSIYPAMSLYQELRVDKFRRGIIAPAGIIGYVAIERLKEFGFTFLTQITVFRRIAAFACCAVYGFSCAVLEGFYVQQYAVKGLVIFLATITPHYIFYVLSWYKLCGIGPLLLQHRKEALFEFAKVFGGAIVLLFIGIICESIFNIRILKIFL